MNDLETEKLIFGLLNAFLSNENEERGQAEVLYDQLESNDPNLMSSILCRIVKHNPKNFECILALVKLGDLILGSLISDESRLSDAVLAEAKSAFIDTIAGDYPTQVKDYVMSVVEDFLYISDGRSEDWPQLFPSFVELLESGKHLEYPLSFFNTLIQIHPSHDCSLMVLPKLELDNPNPRITLASFRFLISEIYNHPVPDKRVRLIPEIVASLPDELFTVAFNCLWKLIKRAPHLFESMSAELVGMVLAVARDPSLFEAQRVAAMYYFGKLIRFSKACEVLAVETADGVLKVFVVCLSEPRMLQDLYRESEDVLESFVDVDLMLDVVNSLCVHENCYVASVFVRFLPDRFVDAISKYLVSHDEILIGNALKALDNLEHWPLQIVKLVIDGLRRSFSVEFVERLTKWCFECSNEELHELSPEILEVISHHPKDATVMLCESAMVARGYGCDSGQSLFNRVQLLFSQSMGDPRLLEVLSKIVPVMDQKQSTRLLYAIMPAILDDIDCVNSTEFCVFFMASGDLILPFVNVIIDVLLQDLKTTENPSYSVETLCNVIELSNNECLERIDNLYECAVELTSRNESDLRVHGFRLMSSLLTHFWEIESLRTRAESLLPEFIETELDMQCYDILLLLVTKIMEDKSTSPHFRQVILDQITIIISRAVESDSETIFAAAGSIFSSLLKVLPDETTKVFFQIQKVFPRYSQSEVVASLRSFSLMMWTDFVLYGREQDTEQYKAKLAKDLVDIIKDEQDEKLRIDAVIACSAFYNSHKVAELQVERLLDVLYSIASEKDSNTSVVVSCITCFCQLFETHWTEKTFPARTQQLLSLLPCPLLTPGPDADQIYDTVMNLILAAWKNPELRLFVGPYSQLMVSAIEHGLISTSLLATLDHQVQDQFDVIPDAVAAILQLWYRHL